MLAAFIDNPKKFLSEIAKHAKSLGAKQVVDPLENASEPGKSTPAKSDAEPTTAAGAMAKHGKRNDAGYSS
jgi:hypothetical protein